MLQGLHVFIQRRQAGHDLVADPSRQWQTPGSHRLRSEQGVIETTQAQTHYQEDRQLQTLRQVGSGFPFVQGDDKASHPFYHHHVSQILQLQNAVAITSRSMRTPSRFAAMWGAMGSVSAKGLTHCRGAETLDDAMSASTSSARPSSRPADTALAQPSGAGRRAKARCPQNGRLRR